ncbi:hypothetical protein CCM_00609 [Cordyceps militaris CM01]|uniref:Uncharacterized protein n=1 Tax=Cordyceps militaris (strain CM01) TaxID=983644 RepID=G3J541_CORMM|nr:uncharacterized protein CCM_00609 [Cordyceps militaris CM01]EGX95955.1 hypothetical protein CCM_00609 [Cordyceps militaris CM01]
MLELSAGEFGNAGSPRSESYPAWATGKGDWVSCTTPDGVVDEDMDLHRGAVSRYSSCLYIGSPNGWQRERDQNDSAMRGNLTRVENCDNFGSTSASGFSSAMERVKVFIGVCKKNACIRDVFGTVRLRYWLRTCRFSLSFEGLVRLQSSLKLKK